MVLDFLGGGWNEQMPRPGQEHSVWQNTVDEVQVDCEFADSNLQHFRLVSRMRNLPALSSSHASEATERSR
jgi:hypothetical protein